MPQLPPKPPAAAPATSRRRPTLCLLAVLAVLAAGGCGGTVQVTANPTPTPPSGYTGVAVSGTARAAAKPLAGSSVQLFAAGVTGNGSAPTPLGSSATTDSAGAFTISPGYSCPSAASQLFLTASGGTVSGASGALKLIVPLGRCDAVSASTRFVVNEVTTAGTAWALSQFLAPGGNLGASPTNTSGLANAVAIALSLAGNTTGASPGSTFPPNGTSPAPRLNALADLLSLCATSSADCTKLLSLTTPPTQAAPANTLEAALDLVRNPALNVAALFALAGTSSAYAPALSSAPADWTLPLTFSGGGLKSPGPLAIGSDGGVWVASYFGVVSEFSPLGAPIFPSGITGSGLSQTYGLAIDPSNNIWVTDENSPGEINGGIGSVTVLSPSGQPLSGPTGFSSGGLNFPIAVAIDPNGTAWVIDYGNSHLTQLSPSGQPLSGASGYFSNLFAFPVALAIDASHNVWVANMSGNNIVRISADGQQTVSSACCNTAAGLALDFAGNVWVANYLGDSVSEVSSSGTVLSSGFTGGGLNHPQGIAVDGAGDVWVANFRGNSITELAGASSAHPGQALSPSAGFAPTPASLQTFALAIDASGNLWSTNFAANSITELVGIAAPVKTPLSALPKLP